jgi:putative selenate reductase
MATEDHCTELYPFPFTTLARRLVREMREGREVYGLRRAQWWVPAAGGPDLSLEHVGGRAATPLGPASGPHTQLAQNIVLAWLGGSRFMELKTVQVLDDLKIPRPCIYVPHVGYNVEWSQELRVHESAREYAKAWMLVHWLASALGPGLWPAVGTLFDMSLGYDLRGIQSPKVRGFIAAMQDASTLLAELRAELPADLAAFAELPVPARISGSTTLSTFHGCPADEIEAIATHTMRAHGLHTVVKLNPTLLGFERCRELLHDTLGYTHIRLEREPFDKDLKWAQLMDMVPRLRAVAAEVGVTVGFKLTNTLVMHSPEPPFGEGEMYLSGPPLHVLAVTLAEELRRALGPDVPLTFSAGVDAKNFPDCVAGGLGPVTTCSDLLKSKGYGRLPKYLKELETRMHKARAASLAELRLAEGGGSAPQEAAAGILSRYAESVRTDGRYRADAQKAPKKVGSELDLFDCLTCDLCIPVCPNAANFSFPAPAGEYRPGRLTWEGEHFELGEGEPLLVEKRHQIGCTADACNQCGECDLWCPEDGGPYLVKPNLFLSARSFEEHPEREGFLLSDDRRRLLWRRGSQLYAYVRPQDGGPARFEAPDGHVLLDGDRPVATAGHGDLDLRLALSMRLVLEGLEAGLDGTWLPPSALS